LGKHLRDRWLRQTKLFGTDADARAAGNRLECPKLT
jgi:hypothetical protein